jgi:hypothetical protein
MDLIVHLPDDLAARLAADGTDLERRALEALAAEGYRAGHLTKPDLRRLLGYETGHEIEGFLKAHDVYDGITLEELNHQLETQDLNSRTTPDDLVAKFQAFASIHTLGGLDLKDLISEGRQ